MFTNDQLMDLRRKIQEGLIGDSLIRGLMRALIDRSENLETSVCLSLSIDESFDADTLRTTVYEFWLKSMAVFPRWSCTTTDFEFSTSPGRLDKDGAFRCELRDIPNSSQAFDTMTIQSSVGFWLGPGRCSASAKHFMLSERELAALRPTASKLRAA